MSSRRSGAKPVLTEAQRVEVANKLELRARIEAAIRGKLAHGQQLRIEVAELERQLLGVPTLEQLVKRYGVAKSTIWKASNHTYRNLNRLDAKAQASARAQLAN